MANIDNLKRQHNEITQLINDIGRLIEKSSYNNASEIAININALSGKLKMHLGSEDKFLYPELLKSESTEIKRVAGEYIKEMGSISEVFMDFKDRFNTRTKIMGNPEVFKQEFQNILKLLGNRMQKEDRYLYPLLSE